jgi:hypothetical protein
MSVDALVGLVVMFVSVCYLLNNSDSSIQGVWGN